MAPPATFNHLLEEMMGDCFFCNKRCKVQPCFKCRKAYYCTKKCRLNDHPRHRKQCEGTKKVWHVAVPDPRHESNHHPPPGLHPPPSLLPPPGLRPPQPPHHPPGLRPSQPLHPATHNQTPPATNLTPPGPLSKPFHALSSCTWLHDRSLETTALLLHDTYRHRSHLNAAHNGTMDQVILTANPLVALERWIGRAAERQLLPSTTPTGPAHLPKLVKMALAMARTVRERGGDTAIPAATANNNANDNTLTTIIWDDAFMAERHGDERIGLQMRAFGEQVMGWAAGRTGDQSRKTMLSDGALWDDLLKWEDWQGKGAAPGFDWRAIFEGL